MATDYPIEIKPEYGAVPTPAAAPLPPDPSRTVDDPNAAIPVGGGYYNAPGTDPNKKGRKPGLFRDPTDAYAAGVSIGSVEDPNHVANPKYDGPSYADSPRADLKYSLMEPENYANARAAQAGSGRDPSIDQRNFWIGRDPEGANKLRQKTQEIGAEAYADAGEAAARSAGYGEALGGTFDALAGASSTYGKAAREKATTLGESGYASALKHGDALDEAALRSRNFGEVNSAKIRAGADRAAQDIRATMAGGETPSAVSQQFGLLGDRAIREAARTGNRAGAAETMSKGAADVARMRADEINTFRNRDLDSRVSASGLGVRGSANAARVNNAGYLGALNAAQSGANARLDGSQLLTDSLYSGYNTELGAERLAADARNMGRGARISGYGSAADTYADAMDDVFAASDLQQNVDEIDMRGSIGLWEDDSARKAAYREAEAAKERAEAAKEMGYIEAGAKGASTFFSWF